MIFYFLIIISSFLASLFISQLFKSLSLNRNWGYRIAFVLGFCLPLLFIYLFRDNDSIISHLPKNSICFLFISFSILCSFFGAFAGVIISTAIHDQLWEDNAPPANQIQIEVIKRHHQIIGDPTPEKAKKRIFDVLLSLIGLVISMPIWLFIAFIIWFEDPGPILFVKNSVTKGGYNFRQFKFRTMVSAAEVNTGPVMESQGDARVLLSGRFLRKTALDELPQLINIISGEMSIVGPRPQRTVLVNDYLQELPQYAERHRVLPGLAGLAQVVGDYYLTPHQKLRFDRLYIRYMGFWFDLKLIVLAFLIAFWFRWRESWNGRLPRTLIRFGSDL